MMLTMDYTPQYAPSTMSSETLSGSCGSRTNRIRTVRLVRPAHGTLPPLSLTCKHGPSLGFSVRGGREHGTGFFVSHVELGTEAHRQGLRVGDQIIRVNGFTVDDAVHKEILQLISNHTHLTLKVRSVGMIPVKDKKTDSLSWQIITDTNSMRSSPPLSEKIQDVRINIMVAPRSKLGCGICKGPDWKPGIFVQFTKEGGIAREAGLRPGDQILFCNNVDFSDIGFNEAVSLMKTSRQLDLIVRKSVGSELFPGESSGYNSSASSVTGDQSPSWSDSKRLSIVKEEDLKAKKYWDDTDDERQYFKPTIINLSENGTTIRNNGTEEESLSETVVVEVHRSDEESTSGGSLSSAISREIQRRSEKKQVDKPSIDEQLQMKKILKGVTSEKQSQHNKLMDEFKKAHQKMFKAPEEDKKEAKKTLDRMAGKELSQKLSERLSTLQEDQRVAAAAPPPPPPPPGNAAAPKKGKAPPVPVKTSTLSHIQSPPPCPTPDYDTISITSSSSFPKNGFKTSQDAVEMDSMDSFKLNNPLDAKPKPPETYFKPTLNGGPANRRPVSVTIGEYPSGTIRRNPQKLDFLQGGDSPKSPNTPISSQLASELAQTLNRSNLKKRTESMENLLNGSVKSVTDLERFNRVTINVAGGPSGILKNGTHKALVQQKSITFGETPTVINDRPSQVT